MKTLSGVILFFIASATIAASGAGEQYGDSHIPFAQIGWQAANLGILLVAIFVFLKKSMIETFAKRREDFIAQSEKTKVALKEAESALVEIKQRLAKLESGEKAALEAAQSEAAAMASSLIKEAELLSEKIKKDADLTIKNELAKARVEINNAILNQALAGTKKTLADKTQGAATDLEKSFVNQLGQVRA